MSKVGSCSINEVTGDSIITRKQSKAYEANYDKVFGKKEEKKDIRLVVWYTKENGLYKFILEGKPVAGEHDYLSALEMFPKTEYIWKEVVNE